MLIDEEDSKKLEHELKTNNYLEEEVINISKSIAPWIPYIGLTLAGITIGRYAYTRYLRHKKETEVAQDACATPGGSQEDNQNKNDTETHPDRGVEQTEP